jgi:hypothetical protein
MPNIKLCEYVHSSGKPCNKPIQFYQSSIIIDINEIYKSSIIEKDIYRFCKRHKVSGPLSEAVSNKYVG